MNGRNAGDMDEKKVVDESQEFLAAIEATRSEGIEETLKLKGIPIVVPASSKLQPRLGDTAYTKRWQPMGDFKKKKRKMSKQSRRKNRKKRRK